MFRAKTVFVIGAGASAEVGLPVGSELLRQIVNLTQIRFDFNKQVSGERRIVDALKLILDEGQSVDKLNEYLKACWQLGDSSKQAMSIDNVIDALEDEKIDTVGKVGISAAILMDEAASRFFHKSERNQNSLILSNFDDTWYNSLIKILTENVRKSNVDSIFDNLEIVNFNYDRCLEQYLVYSISNYYGLLPEDTYEIVNSLVIHRPYGLVGYLPWQNTDEIKIGFGEHSPQQIAEASKKIRTFTEGMEESVSLEGIKTTIAEADRIFFLGFGFHRQNIEILKQGIQDHTEVISTAHGISGSDKKVIVDELQKAFITNTNIILSDNRCNDFFKTFWRTLTAEVEF